MPSATDIYTNCDDLDRLPELMKTNYLHESALLTKLLPLGSTVLQVGSMDGTRAVRLLRERPDLQLSGLELEAGFVEIARKKTADAGVDAQFLQGDITRPPRLPQFDYVICLNNTLGYIPDENKAIAGMKKLGKAVILSVYGEKFTDGLARAYFHALGLTLESIQVNTFILEDFTQVRRYGRRDVEAWSEEIEEAPAGYFILCSE